MEENEVIKIVIADNEYMETYAPLPKDKEQAVLKVKTEILRRRGISENMISRYINQVDVEFKEGVDGRFDDGPYTPIKLVRKIDVEPPIIKGGPKPIKEDLEPEKDPRQTMLQSYYGDSEAEKEREQAFERFKSHIVQKETEIYDKDGSKRKITIYTIEDYAGKEYDADRLLLSGYQTRLERLSRAHQKDFSPYEREFLHYMTIATAEIMERYYELRDVAPKYAEEFKDYAMSVKDSFNGPESKVAIIQALIDRDIEFIETNNYSYNSRQNTSENLKTLGKFGEPSVKAQISDEQSFFQKTGLHTMNALIEIRNHTTAPVNKAIGTFVISPIFRFLSRTTESKNKDFDYVDGYFITPIEEMLATSQKRSKGLFRNKPSHRYHARKDYYIRQVALEEQERLKEKARIRAEKNGTKYDPDSVKMTSIGTLLKLAIIPRWKAIFNYRAGNVAVLNAGLNDIEEATRKRNIQKLLKFGRVNDERNNIASYEKDIDDLEALEAIITDPEQKEQMAKVIEQRKCHLLRTEAKLAEILRMEIDSVQTDAVSMSQHDKANKANITQVVKGVRTAGRVAVGTYISQYLYREIVKQTQTDPHFEYKPGEPIVVTKEVLEEVPKKVPGMNSDGIQKITLNDIYAKGNGDLSYAADNFGRHISDQSSFFRGLKFDYEGKMFSGSDGKGFDPTVLTDVKLDQPINENTAIVSMVQEILEDRLGQKFTSGQIAEMIADGKISKFDVWRSSLEEGVPSGWSNASDLLEKVIKEGSHEVIEEVPKIIEKTITPWRFVPIPGKESFETIREIDPIILAAEAGLGALEASNINDLFRFTRSQESIQIRQPDILKAMELENANKNPRKEVHSAPNFTARYEIKSFQRNNKPKSRNYFSTGEHMEKMSKLMSQRRRGVTVFKGFFGTREEDFNSGYDENLIGVNSPEVKYDIKDDNGR